MFLNVSILTIWKGPVQCYEAHSCYCIAIANTTHLYFHLVVLKPYGLLTITASLLCHSSWQPPFYFLLYNFDISHLIFHRNGIAWCLSFLCYGLSLVSMRLLRLTSHCGYILHLASSLTCQCGMHGLLPCFSCCEWYYEYGCTNNFSRANFYFFWVYTPKVDMLECINL